MQSSGHINEQQVASSGPVSLSQILDRDVVAPLCDTLRATALRDFSDGASGGVVVDSGSVGGAVGGSGESCCTWDTCHVEDTRGSMPTGGKLPPIAGSRGGGGTDAPNKAMGNGTSAASSHSSKSDKSPLSATANKSNMPLGSNKLAQGSAYPPDYLYLKEKVKEFKEQKRDDDRKLDDQQSMINSLKWELKARNDEVSQLKREVHKLKVSKDFYG